jgi:pilus assembly protein CpaB
MVTKPSQHRMSRLPTGAVVRFSALLVAATLAGHYNPFGPNISPGELSGLRRIVVAKVNIPVGSRIVPEQLTVAQFRTNGVPEGAFAVVDDRLLGRIVVTNISPHEPVTESRLAPEGAAAGGLSAVIPEGYRAMTVTVDEVIGVSGFVMPGTLVDIIVLTSLPKSTGQADVVSKIILQNVKVLASDQNIDKTKNDREVGRSIRAVTLQVTPEQSEKLALASSEGKLQLVNHTRVDTP